MEKFDQLVVPKRANVPTSSVVLVLDSLKLKKKQAVVSVSPVHLLVNKQLNLHYITLI